MRPPEFTGGNNVTLVTSLARYGAASMRPPEFTGGNSNFVCESTTGDTRFNEAAGIHRRKPIFLSFVVYEANSASMRPPEFTGGNPGALVPATPATDELQ